MIWLVMTQLFLKQLEKNPTGSIIQYDGNSNATAVSPADLISSILQSIYPVGSIYFSVNNTNPSTLFGGTWVSWGAGRVPVSVASSGTFNTVEKTGGDETHTLTVDELANHRHAGLTVPGATIYWNNGKEGTMTNGGISQGTGLTVSTAYTGSNTPHNNLQPYITCYMWKRTA